MANKQQSVLTKEAATLNCKVRIVKVPLTFPKNKNKNKKSTSRGHVWWRSQPGPRKFWLPKIMECTIKSWSSSCSSFSLFSLFSERRLVGFWSGRGQPASDWSFLRIHRSRFLEISPEIQPPCTILKSRRVKKKRKRRRKEPNCSPFPLIFYRFMGLMSALQKPWNNCHHPSKGRHYLAAYPCHVCTLAWPPHCCVRGKKVALWCAKRFTDLRDINNLFIQYSEAGSPSKLQTEALKKQPPEVDFSPVTRIFPHYLSAEAPTAETF